MTDPYSPPSAPARALTSFKFKFLDGDGKEQGFFSKKGAFDGRHLKLDGDELPVEVVLRAERRFNRLFLVILRSDGPPGTIGMAITKGKAGNLARDLNRESSQRWADLERRGLEEAGQGETFRAETCPYCEATVTCSGFPRTRQIYCKYCDSLATLGDQRPRGESSLGLCDSCNYYASPQPFTTFYFYFLLIVYGFSSNKRYMCHSCMRGEAWKMLLINLIFILGVPFALIQLVRAYQGGRMSMPDFPQLDAANAAAKAGKWSKAQPLYEAICARLPAAAAVRYNQGLCLLEAERLREATDAFELADHDCSNFPALGNQLLGLYERSGREDAAAALRQRWGVEG